MFTGIIKHQTKIIDRAEKNKILTFSFSLPKGLKIEKGKSVNINGICSTIKSSGKKYFSVDYMPETREKTTINNWAKGSLLNLEESVRPSTLLDGHIVQGHIDAKGTVKKIDQTGDSKLLEIKTPKNVLKFISQKGSVSIDGVSLTIVKSGQKSFSTALIPYTLKNTNLGLIKKGDQVNIETDILIRYLYNLIKSK